MKAGGPKFSGLFKGTKLLFDYDFLELDSDSCWLRSELFDFSDMEYEKNRCFKCDGSGKIQKDDFGKLLDNLLAAFHFNSKS